MNQYLEIALRAYIGPERDDWHTSLDALALSYNTSPHTATRFSPAYLLRGYHPITSSTLISNQEGIDRPRGSSEIGGGEDHENLEGMTILHEKALDIVEGFEAERHKAQEALLIGQTFQ